MTERIVIRKNGYNDLIIRKIGDEYEMLMNTDIYGGEKWQKITLPIEIIERDIGLYGVK